jgi:hypothetical protein
MHDKQVVKYHELNTKYSFSDILDLVEMLDMYSDIRRIYEDDK